MSIIHDALKKVKIDITPKPDERPEPEGKSSPETAAPLPTPPKIPVPIPSAQEAIPSKNLSEKNSWPAPLPIVFAAMTLLILFGFFLFVVPLMNGRPSPQPAADKAARVAGDSNPDGGRQTELATPVPPAPLLKPGRKAADSDGSSYLIVNGVIDMDGQNMALIDNVIYEVGDFIDGEEIVEIIKEGVSLKDVAGEVRFVKVKK